MLRLGEGAEGLRSEAEVARGDGWKLEVSTLEEVEQFGEHLVDAVESSIGEIESAVGDARVERGELGSVSDIGLSHLDESPTGRQQSKRSIDEVTCEGIEDDVEAAAAGGLTEVVLEVEGSGGSDVSVVEA
jgi:hypothetical protein